MKKLHIDEVKKIIEDNPKGLFLISGCGRSGTLSCAEYLGGYHEPRNSDWIHELEMFNGNTSHGMTVKKFLSAVDRPYIEVNSAIAPIVRWLKNEIPELHVFHIVRKKEDVINSIMKRENYTPESELRNSPEPKEGFPEHFTRRDKVEWMVDQYYKFMEGFPQIETETIPIIRNES